MNEDAAVEVLLKGSNGLILLAYYRLKILSTNRGTIHTQEDLNKVLSTLSADLREFYNKALRNLEAQDPSKSAMMRRIFLWLIYSKLQLTFRELSTAVAVRSGGDTSAVPSQHLMLGGIESLCGGLVVPLPRKDIESSEDLRIVALAHTSAREYVLDFAWNSQSPSLLLRDSSACSSEIAQSSIAYMYSNQGRPLSDSLFLDYVYQFWVMHLFSTDSPTPPLANDLVKFLSSVECFSWWEATDRDLHWPTKDRHVLWSGFHNWITKVAPGNPKLGQTLGFMTTLQKRQLDVSTKRHGRSHPLWLKFMANLVSGYWISGMPREAESLGAELVSRCKKVNLSNNPDTLDALSELSEVYGSLYRMSHVGWMEAEELQRLIIETRTSMNALGEPDAGILRFILGLAIICGTGGRVAQANLHLQKIIDIGEGILRDLGPPDDQIEQIDSRDQETSGGGTVAPRQMTASTRTRGVDHPETLKATDLLSLVFSFQGKTQESEAIGLKVFEKCKRLGGMNNPYTWEAMGHLAAAYALSGKSKEAESLVMQLIKHHEAFEKYSHDATLTLDARPHPAHVYRIEGREDEAIDLQIQVFSSLESSQRHEHDFILRVLERLQEDLSKIGVWEEAKKYNEMSTAKCIKMCGERHPRTLATMCTKAVITFQLGRSQEAIDLIFHVIETAKRSVGEDHWVVIKANEELAAIYTTMGRWGEAEDLYRRLKAHLIAQLGLGHPLTHKICTGLANVCCAQGRDRWEDEEDLGFGLLNEFDTGIGERIMIEEESRLAYLYNGIGRQGGAEELYLSSLRRLKSINILDNHSRVRRAMYELAATYRGQGRWKEAKDTEVRILVTCRKVLGDIHPETLKAMANLATTYWAIDRKGGGGQRPWRKDLFSLKKERSDVNILEDLEGVCVFPDMPLWRAQCKVHTQILAIHKTEFSDNHVNTFAALSSLSLTHRCQGQWKDAAELEEKIILGFTNLLGNDHPYIRATRDRTRDADVWRTLMGGRGAILTRLLTLPFNAMGLWYWSVLLPILMGFFWVCISRK